MRKLFFFLIVSLIICCAKNPNEIELNSPPRASFTISPSFGDISAIFKFDASFSNDNEDSLSHLHFSWDWENDGTWDIKNSTNYYSSHRFSSIGNYQVKLKLTDTDGLYDETTQLVIVTGIFTDTDGEEQYRIVKIGDQIWMAENLRRTNYRNGDIIPNVKNASEWKDLTTGAYCNYNNNEETAKTYGKLYNGYAVKDRRNIAPEGWHVATDAEWQTLIDYLSGDQVAGGKMKETGTEHWRSPNADATNVSGFSALPGGYRDDNGYYSYLGNSAYFWSSYSTHPTTAWFHHLFYNYPIVTRDYYRKRYGFSVRCVKD